MTDTTNAINATVERCSSELMTAVNTAADAQKGIVRGVEAIGQDLAVMREILGKTDEDGVSLAYAPRRWGDRLDNILRRIDGLIDPLSKMVIGQGDLINIVHKIDGRLEYVILEEQKWRGEVRGGMRTVDDINHSVRSGVRVKDCANCPVTEDVGEVESKVSVMAPQMHEAHQFVLKWKYGFIPFIIVVVSSLLTVILKLFEIFTKGGAVKPPTP